MIKTFSVATAALLFVALSLGWTHETVAQCAIHGQPFPGQPVFYQPVVVQPVRTQPATQPVVVTPQPAVSPAVSRAKNKTDVARAYFKTHQYSDAQRHLDEVVKLVPRDTNAFQFRSLVLFAQGKYGDAAADAYDSIGLGNTWTAEVLDSIYPSADRYHQHLAQLKKETGTSPSMQNHFLLAYHFLMLNDLASGKAELEQVLVLQPEEPLTTKLLAAVSARLEPKSTAATGPTTSGDDDKLTGSHSEVVVDQ